MYFAREIVDFSNTGEPSLGRPALLVMFRVCIEATSVGWQRFALLALFADCSLLTERSYF